MYVSHVFKIERWVYLMKLVTPHAVFLIHFIILWLDITDLKNNPGYFKAGLIIMAVMAANADQAAGWF